MITDDDVLRLMREADPARAYDDHVRPDASSYLAALHARSNTVTDIRTEPAPHPQSDTDERRPWLMLGVAAAVIAVVIAGLVLLTRNDGETGQLLPADEVPTNTTVPAPEPQSGEPIGEPTERAAEFLFGFDTGDLDHVGAMLADEFVMRGQFPGDPLGEVGPFEWLGLQDLVIGRTVYAEPECIETGTESDLVLVECTTTTLLAAHQVSNSDGVPTTIVIRLGVDGVAGMDVTYRENLGLLPFEGWKEVKCPALSATPTTEAEALAWSTEHARCARQWPELVQAVLDATIADANAGDLDAFLARFRSGVAIFGVPARTAEEAYRALLAGGARHDVAGCVPDGVAPAGLRMTCDIVITHPSVEHSGVQIEGQVSWAIGAEDTVWSTSLTSDRAVFDEFDLSFEQWLEGAYPNVHARISWVGDGAVPTADDQPIVAEYYGEFVAQSDTYPLDG